MCNDLISSHNGSKLILESVKIHDLGEGKVVRSRFDEKLAFQYPTF